MIVMPVSTCGSRGKCKARNGPQKTTVDKPEPSCVDVQECRRRENNKALWILKVVVHTRRRLLEVTGSQIPHIRFVTSRYRVNHYLWEWVRNLCGWVFNLFAHHFSPLGACRFTQVQSLCSGAQDVRWPSARLCVRPYLLT